VHTMSPEQILCEPLDARTDVYALGVLLYQLLTGRIPFMGQVQEIARMHVNAPRPRPSALAPISPALDAVVMRAMERDKDRRYPSMQALLDDLRRVVRGDAPADRDREKAQQALGVYLEVRTGDAELDDTILDDIGAILDLGEEALRTAGFAMALQTSNAL